MILSVTSLGSRIGDAAGAATKVVRYLDGRGRYPKERLGVLEAPPTSPQIPGHRGGPAYVAVAELALAQADLVATNASRGAEAAQVGAEAQRPVRDLLNLVDSALYAQVDAAVADPAPYLSAALGPPPEPGPDRDVWADGATTVEAYRHRELGLAPADGPLSGDDPLFAAIGTEPDDFAAALLRQATAARIAADELAVDVAQPDFGIDL